MAACYWPVVRSRDLDLSCDWSKPSAVGASSVPVTTSEYSYSGNSSAGRIYHELVPSNINSFVLLTPECPGIGHEDTNASIGEHFVMRKGKIFVFNARERDICQVRAVGRAGCDSPGAGWGPLTASAGNLCFSNREMRRHSPLDQCDNAYNV